MVLGRKGWSGITLKAKGCMRVFAPPLSFTPTFPCHARGSSQRDCATDSKNDMCNDDSNGDINSNIDSDAGIHGMPVGGGGG